MDKIALRKHISAKKRLLSSQQIEEASLALAKLLFSHPLYKQADTIYAYLSYNQEVRTAPIINQALLDGKKVAVPKIFDNTMAFVYIDESSLILPGYKGIPEPVSNELANDKHALVLMPGLAFTPNGQRMGYGGGFYDRFLAEEPHPTLALCYDFQLLPQLPVEEHDLPVDAVLSAPILEVTT